MVQEQQRPKCGTKGCNQPALFVYAGKFRCGLCLLKIEEKIKKMKEKMFEDIEEEIENGKE